MTRSKTRTVELPTRKTPTREGVRARTPTNEINRTRRRGGSYAVINKKKTGSTGVVVLEAPNETIQISVRDQIATISREEAYELAQSLLRILAGK